MNLAAILGNGQRILTCIVAIIGCDRDKRQSHRASFTDGCVLSSRKLCLFGKSGA